MNYTTKEKITATEDFLSELESKCWQEIEQLQAQIANLADGQTNDRLRQLLKNLLTSYYVFTGGIETLTSESINSATNEPKIEVEKIEVEQVPTSTNQIEAIDQEDNYTNNAEAHNKYEVVEPFEYFVDFDEPTGDPLTDKDLYNI